jgi:hypothetical protein
VFALLPLKLIVVEPAATIAALAPSGRSRDRKTHILLSISVFLILLNSVHRHAGLLLSTHFHTEPIRRKCESAHPCRLREFYSTITDRCRRIACNQLEAGLHRPRCSWNHRNSYSQSKIPCSTRNHRGLDPPRSRR